MAIKIKTRTLFFAALAATAALAAMPGGKPVHIPADLRDAPASALAGLDAASAGSPQPSAPAPVPPAYGGGMDAKSIIGADDRLEYYEVPPAVRGMADSVAALVLKKPPEGVQGDPPVPLCKSERFHDQPVRAFCTGFLVAGDIMATAGHCINQKSCANTRFVFDFAVKEPGVMPAGLGPESNIYSCAGVIYSHYAPDTREDDFALVRLDRPVAGRVPLPLNTSGRIAEEGSPVLTIGNFLGVPLKISMNGVVRLSDSISTHSGLRWFTTSLDTFPGNSGGPVINTATGLVEGVNVRSGGRTFPHFDVTPEGCRVARVYAEEEVWGPESVSVSRLLPYLNTPAAPRR